MKPQAPHIGRHNKPKNKASLFSSVLKSGKSMKAKRESQEQSLEQLADNDAKSRIFE